MSESQHLGDDLAQILIDHRERLLALAAYLVGSEVGAEDLLQDACETVLRNCCRPEATVELSLPYVLQTMRNLASNLHRDQHRRARLRREYAHDIRATLGLSGSASDAGVVRSSWVEGLLAQLTPRRRQVVELLSLEGRGTQEVARTLGITEASVKRTRARALGQLRGWLAEEGVAGWEGV